MSWVITAIVVVVVVTALLVWHTYRTLTGLRHTVDESWRGITVQLRRRADLVPNLIETVRGYLGQEHDLLDDAAAARSRMLTAIEQGPAAAAGAESSFQRSVTSLFAIGDAYPDLEDAQNFRQLQLELADNEDKLAASRRFYNSNVATYNAKAQSLPAKAFASSLGLTSREFYDAPDSATIQRPPPATR